MSRPLLTGLDTDNNGLLEPNSADRIQKTVTVYVNTDSFWHLETVQSVFDADNYPAPVITAKTRERLIVLGDGGLVSESVTVDVDIHGKETVSRTFINRADKRENAATGRGYELYMKNSKKGNGQMKIFLMYGVIWK